MLTCNDHHANRENLFIVCFCCNVSKTNTGHAGHGVIKWRDIHGFPTGPVLELVKKWVVNSRPSFFPSILQIFPISCTEESVAGHFKSRLWQYELWSFQMGGMKLERFLPKNQHTQRKLLNFEKWEVSKIGHHFRK